MNIKKVETTEKLKTVADIAQIVWREHFKGIISDGQIEYMLNKFQSIEAISKAVNDEGYTYYIFWEGNIPAGYMGVCEKEGRLFLSKLYLLKEFRKKGFSRQALSFLEDYCKNNGLKSVWLTCNKYNADSLAVYERLGFKTVDTAVTDIGGGYVMDDYILEKTI